MVGVNLAVFCTVRYLYLVLIRRSGLVVVHAVVHVDFHSVRRYTLALRLRVCVLLDVPLISLTVYCGSVIHVVQLIRLLAFNGLSRVLIYVVYLHLVLVDFERSF